METGNIEIPGDPEEKNKDERVKAALSEILTEYGQRESPIEAGESVHFDQIPQFQAMTQEERKLAYDMLAICLDMIVSSKDDDELVMIGGDLLVKMYMAAQEETQLYEEGDIKYVAGQVVLAFKYLIGKIKKENP